MSNKLTVAILCGGRSAEHEVSLQSAQNVIAALNPTKYEVVLITIDKTGQWRLADPAKFLLHADDPKHITLDVDRQELIHNGYLLADNTGIDVVFPILHGPFGEDGTVQGLFALSGIPFVGSGVLGSAVAMDKDVSKCLFRDAGLPIGDYLVLQKWQDMIPYPEVVEELGTPVFVKPANMGSSVGVSKVASEAEYRQALELAFQYDEKLLIEAALPGREVECAILGNPREPHASVLGEILPNADFYSYEAKYIDADGARMSIPAELPAEMAEQIQHMAIDAFWALNCKGLARVDFFVGDEGEIFLNEVNTMPGFTKISMYPQLWRASGVSYSELLDRLIALALEG